MRSFTLSQIPPQAIVILANADTVFAKAIASTWRRLGYEIVIITAKPGRTKILEDGTFLLSVQDYESENANKIRRVANKILGIIEPKCQLALTKRQKNELMRNLALVDTQTFAYKALTYGFLISRLVKHLDPLFVYGMHALDYGFAASLSGEVPKVIFPFGADIYQYANQSRYVDALIRYAFHKADLICPSAQSAHEYLIDRFDLPTEKVKAISWGVDQSLFYAKSDAAKDAIKARLKIDKAAKIIANSRRFEPPWGSDIVVKVFLRVASIAKEAHFLIIPGDADHIDRAIQMIDAAGLTSRFTVFKKQVDLNTYAEIMAISDIFVSLMLFRDMRSSSILQAAACGSVPVLSDQTEYREMMRDGFQAAIVPPGDIEAASRAILNYLDDAELVQQTRASNLDYIDKFESMDRSSREMLVNILNLKDIKRKRG